MPESKQLDLNLLRSKSWYRVMNVLSVALFAIGALVSAGAANGNPGRTIPGYFDYSRGFFTSPQVIAPTPFRWRIFILGLVISLGVVYIFRMVIIYMALGDKAYKKI